MMQVQDVLVLPLLRLLASGVGFVLVTNCLALLFRPAVIGQGGERAVRQALVRFRLPALHDVVLADTFGHTQVDHLVRTAQGIVVIETKTFAGWISGTLYGAQWTVVSHFETEDSLGMIRRIRMIGSFPGRWMTSVLSHPARR